MSMNNLTDPPEIVLRCDEHKEKQSSNVRETPAVDNSTVATARGKQGRVHDELSPRKHVVYVELVTSTEKCSLS
jgi:hypothetical protein